jgi:hypothetical protein
MARISTLSQRLGPCSSNWSGFYQDYNNQSTMDILARGPRIGAVASKPTCGKSMVR